MIPVSKKDNELWRWAEKFADLKEEQREVDRLVEAKRKEMDQLRDERKTLQLRIDAIRKRRNGLVDELVNNREERPRRSEVEDDPISQAKRQEEFSN